MGTGSSLVLLLESSRIGICQVSQFIGRTPALKPELWGTTLLFVMGVFGGSFQARTVRVGGGMLPVA